MDENTKFLLQRIDRLEERIMPKLEKLEGWRNRVLGAAGLISLVVTSAIEIILKKIGA